MKIQIRADVLEEIVSTAAMAISSKPMNTESECVFINVSSSTGSPILTAQASDGGIIVRKVTDKLVAVEDGYALIPAKMLLSFVKLMNGDITMEVDEVNNVCSLRCGSKRTKIACLDADEYNPAFTNLGTEERTVRMDGQDFESLVNSTLHCVSTNQGQLILTGIHFAFDAESGLCEATGLDGFRMAMMQRAAETNESFEITMPSVTAKLVAKLIHEGSDVSFRFGDGLMIVEDYETAIQASLLSGQYIDTKRMIFRDSNLSVKTNGKEFLQAVRLALISAKDNQKGLIVLNFANDDSFTVSARSESSNAVSSVACDKIGVLSVGVKENVPQAPEIAFNGEYVEDALKTALGYGDDVKLLFNTPISPMAVMPMANDSYYQLVLPVRRL